MCLLFLIGNVPNSISPILFTLNVNSLTYSIYVIFGNFMLFISRGSYFFIYYNFNSNFRTVFKCFFRRLLGLNNKTLSLKVSTPGTVKQSANGTPS